MSLHRWCNSDSFLRWSSSARFSLLARNSPRGLNLPTSLLSTTRKGLAISTSSPLSSSHSQNHNSKLPYTDSNTAKNHNNDRIIVMAAGGAGTTTTSPRTMKAAVMHEIGGPEVLKVQSWPIPTPQKGQVLIRVKAFGINRSEMYTRQGHSPGVNFPRILGIEAVGLVEEAPANEFRKGDVVATAMGGMGRNFDGGYAEYTCVPANQVLVVKTKENVPWEVLGALPEMMQTAWGSLFRSLQLVRGDRLLIRGGTSSVGLAAAAIAKNHGAFVAATTRKKEREQLLRSSGADEVFIDNGSIAEEVRKRHPEGFNKILELVGVTTYEDSLRCADENGIVCMTGIVGGKWEVEKWSPIGTIPTAVCLTTYAGTTKAVLATPLDELAQQVLDGKINVPIVTFSLDQIVEAHRCMDESTAGAKIVVLT